MPRKTNVHINGKDYYRVRKVIGHKADGSPIPKDFYGYCEKEANKKADEYMSKIDNGLALDFQKTTLDMLMHKWIYEVKKHDAIKPSTFADYECTYRRYIKGTKIAGLPLYKIKAIHLQDYYNDLSKNKKSSSIIRKINKLLYQFFKYAIKEGYLIINPSENIVIPKLAKEKILREEKIEYFSTDEIEKLKKAIKNTDIELIVLFALGTGLRQGEILALRCDDIDYEKKQVNVVRSVKKVPIFDENNKPHTTTIFSEPKTVNSKRVVDIPEALFELIKNSKNKGNQLLFPDDNGQVMEARKLFRKWKQILQGNNIPYKKFHSLRHTYATLLLSNGVDLLTVSKLLGHSSVKITEIYTHIMPSTKTQAVNKINHIF